MNLIIQMMPNNWNTILILMIMIMNIFMIKLKKNYIKKKLKKKFI